MTKPVIVTRAAKGAPLTRTELDNNFSNLDNATWSVSDGTNSKAFSLNDTLQFTAGTNISVGVDSITGAVTITNTQSAFNPASPGAIGGTTPSTGAFTTVTATTFSGTLSGSISQLDGNELASGPKYPLFSVTNTAGTTYPLVYSNISFDPTVGLTVPSLVASTTATTGALNLTYNPASASGSAINVTGKNSQGGNGYIDFLKITNTSTGATNPNKTFRINSTGGLEIVDSTYTNIRFALTDAGQMTVGGTNFPTSTGTNGQVLTANGSGGSTWAAPPTNTIILSSANANGIVFPASSFTATTTSFLLRSAGGTGATVSTNTFTLPAGTYQIMFPFTTSANASKSDFHIYNITDTTTLASFSYDSFTLGGLSVAMYGSPTYNFTIAGSKTFTLRTTSAVTGGWTLQSGHWSAGYVIKIIKTA